AAFSQSFRKRGECAVWEPRIDRTCTQWMQRGVDDKLCIRCTPFMGLMVERREVQHFLLKLVQVRGHFLAADFLADDRALQRFQLDEDNVRLLAVVFRADFCGSFLEQEFVLFGWFGLTEDGDDALAEIIAMIAPESELIVFTHIAGGISCQPAFALCDAREERGGKY